MNLVFTGFEPFADVDYNPSWDAAQAAAETANAAAELLSVTFETARLAAATPADLIVHFGVASRREAVCLERFAHNWLAELAATPTRIDPDGPAALECSLPLDELARRLDGAAGLTWQVSHDAGTYVCNATLYHALRQRGLDAAMFVHIPPVDAPTARQIGVALAEALVGYDGRVRGIAKNGRRREERGDFF